MKVELQERWVAAALTCAIAVPTGHAQMAPTMKMTTRAAGVRQRASTTHMTRSRPMQPRRLAHLARVAARCAERGRLAAAIVAAVLAAPALAQESAEPWRFELTPYVWGAGMSGSIKVNNKPEAGLAVEQSFSDVFRILDFALMGAFEARKGRLGVLADAVYFKVNDEGSISGPLGFVSLAATAEVTQQMYSLGGAYRVVEGSSPLDVVGGMRYTSVRWDVAIQSSTPLVAARGFRRNNDWVDPYLGVRLQHALDDRWSLLGYADIGGFGVGSDLALQALAGVHYAFRSTLVGKFGVRYVSADYESNDFKYDMANAGVYFGLGFRW